MNKKRTIFLFDTPEIKIEPDNVKMAVGYVAGFFCGANGYGLTYSWEERPPRGNWGESYRFGAQSPYLRVTAAKTLNGYQFRCKVKSGSLEFTSTPATLTVG